MNERFIYTKYIITWDEISEDSYLRRIEALKNMQSLQLCKPITIFTGENGSGKSTLLEAIATLLLEIYECAKEGAQFIIATHSPILLGIPGAEISSFDDGKIHSCEYEETGSYQITKMFIEDRKQILGRLL